MYAGTGPQALLEQLGMASASLAALDRTLVPTEHMCTVDGNSSDAA